jgi:FAD/FMN-containing dehydrogenase
MTPQMDTSERNELRSVVQGTIHLPGGDGYDEARQVWNGMIDRRPAGVADVIATVRFAGERRLPVAIRCGGHNVAGSAVGDGGIVTRRGGATTGNPRF